MQKKEDVQKMFNFLSVYDDYNSCKFSKENLGKLSIKVNLGI